MKAVRIHEFGGLDVLRWEEVDRPTPRPNQVLIKVDAAGVNYADLMRRQGGYPGPDLPSTLGLEAAGTIEELGDAVSGLTVGQRVMGMGPQGNAEYVAVNANQHRRQPGEAIWGIPVITRDFFSRLTNKCLDYFLSRALSYHVGEGRRFTTLAQQAEFSKALDLSACPYRKLHPDV